MPDAHESPGHSSQDRGNDSPLDFLATKARITRRILDAANSHVWIRDTFACVNLNYNSVAAYRLFDLKDAPSRVRPGTERLPDQRVARPGLAERQRGSSHRFRRVRAEGEDYWWG